VDMGFERQSQGRALIPSRPSAGQASPLRRRVPSDVRAAVSPTADHGAPVNLYAEKGPTGGFRPPVSVKGRIPSTISGGGISGQVTPSDAASRGS